MAIPKLIHQTVVDKNRLNQAYIDNINFLQEMNPDWTYNLYDDNDILRFLQNNYDQEIFQRYRKISPRYGAAKADYFRYLLLLKVGGVYLDIKSTCRGKLSDSIYDDDVFFYRTGGTNGGNGTRVTAFFVNCRRQVNIKHGTLSLPPVTSF